MARSKSKTPKNDDEFQEMFNEKLYDIVHQMSVDEILAVPGVYEILAEELNNEILEELGVGEDPCSDEEE